MKTQFNVRLSETTKSKVGDLVKHFHSDKTKVTEKAIDDLHDKHITTTGSTDRKEEI